MDISYKKDIHHNYLVVSAIEEKTEEAYCVKMLDANSIGGIIRPENRIIDGQVLYYYEITSKQSLDIIYAKAAINYEKIKKLFTDLLDIINRAYEYLLNANDLVIDPEYIYIELSTKRAHVCYLPGYNTELNEQIIKLIEYIMNKLEYKDKEAVLYVYNLYSICKEEGASFSNFYEAVKKDKQEGSIRIDTRKAVCTKDNKSSSREIDNNIDKSESHNKEENVAKEIPIMMEKILDEIEEYYYPIKIYIYTGLSIMIAIALLYLSYSTKIIYTSMGNRVDYSKLLALILILLCLIGYLMKKIWAKNMRLTRIVSRERYYDPRKEDNEKSISFPDPRNEDNEKGISYPDRDSIDNSINKSANKFIDKPMVKTIDRTIDKGDNLKSSPVHKMDKSDSSDEYCARTVLLNEESEEAYRGECYLKPESEDICEPIWIQEFPFIIGKQKDNVDYYLNKDVVSRYHVKISKENEKYYITDLNSTNGTCLNKTSLPCYQRYEITQGDEATIAGIKYIFNIPLSASIK